MVSQQIANLSTLLGCLGSNPSLSAISLLCRLFNKYTALCNPPKVRQSETDRTIRYMPVSSV